MAEREKETYYILPEEIKIPKEPKVKLSEDRLILTVPGGEYEAAGCKIRTLRSTDEGVAYLVSYRGKEDLPCRRSELVALGGRGRAVQPNDAP